MTPLTHDKLIDFATCPDVDRNYMRDRLLAELHEARSTAYILVHAYDSDSRPPDCAVVRARNWGP